MAENRKCPQCGTDLEVDAPQGLCPQCLLKAGMDTKTSNGHDSPRGSGSRASGARFIPPDPKDLAKHFPQLEILEILGQGGMGVVYKARQTKLDRFVALKILPPEEDRGPNFAERFAREARMLAKLSHPNIVSIHDFGEIDGLFYLLMEFVDGLNLRRLLVGGQLSPIEALRIVPQICDALETAHEHGIVHRDIKPENVLLDKKGNVKIADFGLAKLVGLKLRDATLTGTQQVVGTHHYMAPEQLFNPTEVDHRADIYSLGVVFYEMLTGELPVGRFAPPSQRVEVDVRLDQVVLRALEREPDRRYQQASQIKTDVESISQSAASGVHHVPQPAGAGTMRRQLRFMNALVVLVILAVGFLIVRDILPRSAEPNPAEPEQFTRVHVTRGEDREDVRFKKQDEAPPGTEFAVDVAELQESARRVEVAYLGSVLVTTTVPIARVSYPDGPIGVEVINARSVLITGEDVGSCNLVVWGPEGDYEAFEIHVYDARYKLREGQLLANSGFEEGSVVPTMWHPGPEPAGLRYRWDKQNAHTNDASVVLEWAEEGMAIAKGKSKIAPIGEWTQTIKHNEVPTFLKVSAYVKAQQVRKATISVRFRGGARRSPQVVAHIGSLGRDAPPLDHGWELYSGIVDVPYGTTKITIALEMHASGTVWFDDVTAEFVDEADLKQEETVREEFKIDTVDPMQNARSVSVVKNLAIFVQSSIPIARVDVMRKGILRVDVVNPQRLVIVGIREGSTQVLVWSEDGVLETLSVTVQPEDFKRSRGKPLLVNGGFEEGNVTPTAWKPSGPFPGARRRWDQDVAHQGRGSACLDGSSFESLRGQELHPAGLGQWNQTFVHRGTATRLRVTAHVKAEQVARAFINARFALADDRSENEWVALVGSLEPDGPAADHDWKECAGIVTIPDGTQRITIALEMHGPGKVWFDDVTAEYEAENPTSEAKSIFDADGSG